MPLTLEQNEGYNIFPSHHSSFPVNTGFDSLAEKICNERTVIIDGYGGVVWEKFRQHLQEALRGYNKKIFWFDINTCLRDPYKINKMIKPHLNGDYPVF